MRLATEAYAAAGEVEEERVEVPSEPPEKPETELEDLVEGTDEEVLEDEGILEGEDFLDDIGDADDLGEDEDEE